MVGGWQLAAGGRRVAAGRRAGSSWPARGRQLAGSWPAAGQPASSWQLAGRRTHRGWWLMVGGWRLAAGYGARSFSLKIVFTQDRFPKCRLALALSSRLVLEVRALLSESPAKAMRLSRVLSKPRHEDGPIQQEGT